jgi:UbiA prenyltransferase family
VRIAVVAPHPAPLVSRLTLFLVERFAPAASIPLIVALAACGSVGAAVAKREITFDPLPFSVLVVALVLAFVRLRVVDDLKDAATDAVGRPDRPLPRGLVTADELRAVALGCGAGQLVLAGALGRPAFVACALALGFSLLGAQDFFVARLSRKPLVYALAHSPMVPLLLAFAWWAHPAAELSLAFVSLLILAWGLSLGLEVARKTMAPEEERPAVETYSQAIGQAAATLVGGCFLAAGGIGGAAFVWIVEGPLPVTAVVLAGSLAIAVCTVAGRHSIQPPMLRAMTGLAALVFLAVPTVTAIVQGAVP